MSSTNTKKRRLTEDTFGDEESMNNDDIPLAVNFIKKRDDYESMTIEFGNEISIPPCKCFLSMKDDKYKIFARLLKINTENTLGEADPDLLKFLYQLYFVISKYQEGSLKIIKDITRTLNICVANSKDVITEADLMKWYNNTEASTESDPFTEIYQITTDVLKRVYALHFPSKVKFIGLDAPFHSTTFKTMAVRVSYDTIIGPYEVQNIKVPVSPGSKQMKNFITRKMKSQHFVEELSKFLQHDESCISDLVWRDIDIGIIQQTDDNDTREYVVHQQIGPFDVVKSENYAMIKDLLIYKLNKTDAIAKKFNIRAYTKKTLTFNYDAKLLEEYKDFIECEKLRDISVTQHQQ
jgi:hypothetical protein